MRILITGGAGFIGSHLTEKLISLDHQVTVLDDFSVGKKEYLDKVIESPLFQLVKGSVLDQKLVEQLADGQDTIIHLAASLGVQYILDHPLASIITNLEGTRNVLESAVPKKIRTFITSTSEVYGKNTKVPFAEDDDRVMGATSITRWSYAESKAMDEFLALAYAQERELPVVITRLFNVIGPRQSTQWGFVAARFIENALANKPIVIYGDGTQRRCFGYVDDIVDAYVRLLDCPEAINQVINLGSNQEISVKDLAELVVELTDSHSEITYKSYDQAYGKGFEDMMRRVPDLSKIYKLTGWKPTTSLKTAIIKMMKVKSIV